VKRYFGIIECIWLTRQGFWGDPFNYENEPAAMPLQDGYFPQWLG
jgi:hypothetical protein